MMVGVLPWLAAASVEHRPSPEAVLQAADAPRHVLDEGVMRIRATVRQDDGTPAMETILDVYVRGQDEALCAFRTGAQEGRKILMVGDRVWLILPKTTHPIRVSPNQRLFGGASIGDVARLRFADEFTATPLGTEESVDGVACLVVGLAGRTRRAAYGSGTLWVGKEDGLPRRAVLALPSGKEAKELRFVAYAEDHGRTVLRRLEIHHLLAAERGMVTTLEFLGYDAETLPADFFDPERARELP